MRKTFGKVIVELAEKDKDIYVIVGDIGYNVFDEYRAKFSERFINIGLCEQSMLGVAAGMAMGGLKPWIYTITTFLIERPFEQLKLDIDQQKVNVKLVGYADYPTLGPSHTLLDGKKMMELFHNIKSYFPESAQETREVIHEAYLRSGPSFISLKRDRSLDAIVSS